VARVFHLASPNPLKLDKELFNKINVEGTKSIIIGCLEAGVKELVYTSSASVIFSTTGLRGAKESEPYANPNPDAYCQSKADAEMLVLAANGKKGLKTVAVRPHSIFGEGDPGVIYGLDNAGKKNKLRFIVGKGNNIVDFTYVSNVAWGLILAGEKLAVGISCGKAYHITNDEPMPFWTFVDNFCVEMGYGRPKYTIPYWFMIFFAWCMELLFGETASMNLKKVRLAGLDHWYSCQRAKEELDYKPLVSTSEGLKRSCVYLKKTKTVH